MYANDDNPLSQQLYDTGIKKPINPNDAIALYSL